MNHNLKECKQWADVVAYFMVLVSVFFLPVSTTLNALFIVASFVCLLGERFQSQIRELLQLSVIRWSLALLVILFIGIFYSSAPSHDAWHAFKKYGHRLFAFMVLAPLFRLPRARQYLYITMIVATIIYSLLDTLDVLHVLSIEAIFHKAKNEFLSEIPFSIYVACTTLLTLYLYANDRARHPKWLAALAYQCFYLFFINQQRTGMVVFIAMLFLYICRNLTFRQSLKFIVPGLLISLVIAISSPAIQNRINESMQDIEDYKKGEVHTSLGLRYEFIRYSLLIIKQQPLFGFGTGSFPTEYAKTGGPLISEEADTRLGDPHNSFLHIWIQVGVIGLIIFIGWLVSQWQLSNKLMKNERALLRCFLFGFVLSCFSEAAFYRSRNATLYMTLAVVCIGNLFQRKKYDYNRYSK